MGREVKYYCDPETGDYSDVIEPMSYAEEQLRHAEEKDRTFEPYYRSREYFLDEAKAVVCNDRENQYGSPEDSFKLIAKLWSAYLINGDTEFLSEKDVAIMMALLKIARISSGSFKEDSWIDAIGYLACGAELDSAKRGNK